MQWKEAIQASWNVATVGQHEKNFKIVKAWVGNRTVEHDQGEAVETFIYPN